MKHDSFVTLYTKSQAIKIFDEMYADLRDFDEDSKLDYLPKTLFGKTLKVKQVYNDSAYVIDPKDPSKTWLVPKYFIKEGE